jgi:prepilin-type N-terminal cleavage/methylation domain-containing protein
MTHTKGYTLVELMVSMGLFAIIMLLASGSYLMMISLNRQVQGIASGINNLSFALETMTRTIRTGTGYSSTGSTFSVINEKGKLMMYAYSDVDKTITQNTFPLTDSSSVKITSLTFNAIGIPSNDNIQPQVTITVSGTVPGKIPQFFTIETSATMRSLDI